MSQTVRFAKLQKEILQKFFGDVLAKRDLGQKSMQAHPVLIEQTQQQESRFGQFRLLLYTNKLPKPQSATRPTKDFT